MSCTLDSAPARMSLALYQLAGKEPLRECFLSSCSASYSPLENQIHRALVASGSALSSLHYLAYDGECRKGDGGAGESGQV
jgi:hypothetical protein